VQGVAHHQLREDDTVEILDVVLVGSIEENAAVTAVP
jgi:hypothetical protein